MGQDNFPDIPHDDCVQALDPRQPFTTAQAAAAGLGRRKLQSRSFRRLFRGAYIDSAVIITDEVLAKAALLLSPAGSHVSHHSAARLWGGVAPDDGATHVTSVAARAKIKGIRSHRRRRQTATVVKNGVPLSSPDQVFLDLASVGAGLVDLVVLGDSLVMANRTTPERLAGLVASARGAGSLRAREASSLVRPGARSPMETRLRLLVVLAGLPEPTVGIELRDAAGIVRRTLDLGYRAQHLALEYDGRQHAESTRQWTEDVRRREELDRQGWRLIVVLGADLFRTPGQTLDRIVAAMDDRGVPRPDRIDHQWRAYFPTRERVRRIA